LLLSAIQANVPVALFEIHRLTPGITVFGLSFLTLFSSLILAKDRQSAFLQRLYSSPMRPIEFLLGYALPLIPMGLVQVLVCYLTAVCLGFTISVEILFATLLSLPGIVFFIGLGLFFGSFLTDKQVGGICGALVTNVTALMSGAWFDLTLVGGGFETVANLLPFVHAVEIQRAVVSGVYTDFFVMPQAG
jgi:ABC-2 type transport system permease protein